MYRTPKLELGVIELCTGYAVYGRSSAKRFRDQSRTFRDYNNIYTYTYNSIDRYDIVLEIILLVARKVAEYNNSVCVCVRVRIRFR